MSNAENHLSDVKIPGTTIFDGKMAMKGYNLNKMCFSFNKLEAREEYLADPMAYCDKFGLTDAQKEGVKELNVLKLIEEGGNVYYLAKLTGIYKMNMQDIGAQQTGMTLEAFKEKLLKAGE